ncbi:unnamed protein product [Paramecium sonneborni]|uniref:Cyclin-dependent kinase 2 homolog n=1 Tax=Paramecium sonneborni TaxID=65129 RepID=A0A8S1QGE6_9CILI|nr:unnamed protein product [Paramecium sonneborni]
MKEFLVLQLQKQQFYKSQNIQISQVYLRQNTLWKKRKCCLFYSMQSNLRKYMDRNSSLTLNKIKPIIYKILLGLSFCHSRRVLHMDLKPQNILQNEMMTIKLADFDLSSVFPFPMPKFTKEIATLFYRAPELMLGDNNQGTGVDIWAVGALYRSVQQENPSYQVIVKQICSLK